MRSVRWHLGHYWDIRRAVSEERAARKRRGSTIGGVQDSHLSDPTAAAAISNLTPIKAVRVSGAGTVVNPELWIKAIEVGLSSCEEDIREVARQNFWNHRSWRYITKDMDKKTFYRRRDAAVSAVAVAAAQYGLVKLEEK